MLELFFYFTFYLFGGRTPLSIRACISRCLRGRGLLPTGWDRLRPRGTLNGEMGAVFHQQTGSKRPLRMAQWIAVPL